ncbi:MAG TPA: hypothetical protein VD887_04170 [Allosphingosinicella sp.]|nr:hypothetical protein [Allosphingosinicella sp.]
MKAIKGKPAPGAPAQPGFLVGALIYGLAVFICSGKLSGGYSVWKGAQSEIPMV